MPKKRKRVAIYARVSTAEQTTENQLQELRTVAERHGWEVVEEFVDNGVSGVKASRPAFDRLLKGINRKDFDLIMSWSVDRLGRSLRHLVDFLGDIHEKGIDLYLHQQGLDTSTPSGKALFQMLGVFAEFERAMIQERVKAGLARAKAQGKRLGRPPVSARIEYRVRKARQRGMGIKRIANHVGVGVGTVQRILAQS